MGILSRKMVMKRANDICFIGIVAKQPYEFSTLKFLNTELQKQVCEHGPAEVALHREWTMVGQDANMF